MNEQHHKTKEVDITPYIVAVFVVMVAILIAKVAGDLTRVTTSTSSRASEKKLTAAQAAKNKADAAKNDDKCRQNPPFKDKEYNKQGGDYCRTIGSVCKEGPNGLTNFVRDIRSEKTSRCGLTASDCCRNAEQIYTYQDFYGKYVSERLTIEERLGSRRCVRETSHAEAVCIGSDVVNSDPTLTKANVPCAVRRNNYQSNSMWNKDDVIMDGECYINALAPTISPPPIQPNGKRVDSCGSQYMNCEQTWAAGMINSNNAGNKDKNGQALIPECQGVDGGGIETFHCGVRVDNSVTACDGGQWANPVMLNNGIINECYMTEAGGVTTGTNGGLFKVCIFKPTKEIASIGKNLVTSECKAQALKNMGQ